MINRKSTDELIALGETIIAASNRLEELLHQLSEEADAQFAAASHGFIIQHAKPKTPEKPLLASYGQAHKEAVAAAIRASNLRDLASRATSLRQKCAWWKLGHRRQEIDEIRWICEQLPEWTANFPDEKPATSHEPKS